MLNAKASADLYPHLSGMSGWVVRYSLNPIDPGVPAADAYADEGCTVFPGASTGGKFAVWHMG